MPSTELHASIERLSEMPQASSKVARWIWESWGAKTYTETLASLENPGVPTPLVAVAEGEPVGVVSFARFDLGNTGLDDLWIDALFVAPGSRSHGLGSRLVGAAIETASEEADRLYVYTDISPWYEQRSWQVVQSRKGGTVLRFDCFDS